MSPNLSLKSILKKQQRYGGSEKKLVEEKAEPANPPSWIVQDCIVERGSNQKSKVPKKKPPKGFPSSSTIEGYTPRFRYDSKTKDNEEPIVFHSLSEMMEAAGTLPNQNDDAKNEDPSVIEAELQFRVMQLEDYKREVMGTTEDLEDTEHSSDHEEQEWVDDDDDEDGFLGIFDDDHEEEEEEEEESQAMPPPRAFLRIWEMLSNWVTPEATHYLIHGTSNVPAKTDMEMSRCVALMNLIRLFLPPSTTLAQRETLGELIRRFDFRYPMPDAAGLTKALANILLASLEETPLDNGALIPEACQAVGLSSDEYRYLVRSGLRNFHRHE